MDTMMFDLVGHPITVGSSVAMIVSSDIVVGLVAAIRPHLTKKPVRVQWTHYTDAYVPSMHDPDLWADPVEWWIARTTYTLRNSWQEAARLLVLPDGHAVQRGLPAPVPGGPLVIDWQAIPAKYVAAAMDQDLGVNVYASSDRTVIVPYHEGMPAVPNYDPNDRLVIPAAGEEENGEMPDTSFWYVPGMHSVDTMRLNPWQVLVRPPYYEWRLAFAERPQTTP